MVLWYFIVQSKNYFQADFLWLVHASIKITDKKLFGQLHKKRRDLGDIGIHINNNLQQTHRQSLSAINYSIAFTLNNEHIFGQFLSVL